MVKRRGNPNWCSPLPFQSSASPSAFEQVIGIFKLLPEQYVERYGIKKEWVRINKHNKFIPEDLLKAWVSTNHVKPRSPCC